MSKKDTNVTTLDDEPARLEPAAPVQKIAVTDNGDHFAGEKVELTLHSDEGEIGRQAVFLGINGHGFNIPRDVPVEVPFEVIEVLNNSMMATYEPVPGGGGKMMERHVKRFSYNYKPLQKK